MSESNARAGGDEVKLPVDLRDWFAGQALAGCPALAPSRVAAYAYQVADAMLEARKSQSPPQGAEL